MPFFHGRARVSASSPRAAAICDRCGFLYTHSDLRFQYQYAGARLVNTQLLVCDRCLDEPDYFIRGQALALPPDPVSIENPRPDDPLSMFSVIGGQNGTYLIAQNGSPIAPQNASNTYYTIGS